MLRTCSGMHGRILALIGADGSGKTSVARRVCSEVGERARYVYMGSNPSAATHMLSTTRAWIGLKELLGRDVHHSGPPPAGPERGRPSAPAARALKHLKSFFVLAVRLSEDLYRAAVVATLARRGYLVLLDRHPYADYHAHRIVGSRGWQRWGDRLHGFLLERVYPLPDRMILLDAPAEVLWARKDEGTLEAVELRRRDYLELARRLGEDMLVVDVRRGEDEVVSVVKRLATDGPDGGASRAAAGGAGAGVGATLVS